MEESRKMKRIFLSTLTAGVIAASLTSQAAHADAPILATDIQTDSTYLMARYASASLEQELSNGNETLVEEIELKANSLELMRSGKKLGSITPLISMGVTFYDIEDEEKREDFNIKAGFAAETGNKHHIFYASYDIRQEGYRDNFELAAILRLTDVENTQKGLELALGIDLKEDLDEISGGDQFTVSTNAKAGLNSKWFLAAQLSLGVQTDTEYSDGSYIEHGPDLSAEVGLVFQAHERLQLIGSIYGGFQNHKYYTSSSDYYLTNNQTITGVGLELTFAI